MKQLRRFPQVVVTRKAARALRSGHPWVFEGEVRQILPAPSDGRTAVNGDVVDVLEENGRIIGTACIIEESDPDYLSISGGAWLNDEPYVVVHRIAVPSSCKGNGYASKLLAFAGEKAEENGWRNLRIDTHEKNRSMRRLLEKNGFSMCGDVIVGRWKEPRIAYQKVL